MSIKKNGFTLIELLIVISIIAVLSAIAMIAYGDLLKNARDTRRQSDLKLIQSSLERYHADQKYYPANLNFINTLPSDPNPSTLYFYKAYTPSMPECTECTRYSRYYLYAQLENQPNPIDNCPAYSTYNFCVSSPD